MASEFTEGFNTGDVDRIMRFYGNTLSRYKSSQSRSILQERRHTTPK